MAMDRREFLKCSTLALGALSASSRPVSGSARAENLKTIAEINERAVERFISLFRGQALRPGDAGYESACQNWTGRMTKRPGLVLRCAGARDVAAGVKFARDHAVLTAVRAGGHSSYSSCDGGMLINLSPMKRIKVDPAEQVLHAEAGLTVGEVDRVTCAFNLATVLGECPSVGISGMGLGGGLGRLMGQHGALCDNLLSAQVVTANGELLRAGPEENTDLFWAIRGGGGNFGIVTSFEYQLHPVGQVLSGMLRYPVSETRAVLRYFGEWMSDAPDEMDALVEIGSGILQYAPDARDPTIVINVCCGGDLRTAEKALRDLRAFRRPAADTIRAMPYLEAQNLGDVGPLVERLTAARPVHGRRGFLARFSEEAIEAIAAHCENPPSSTWSIALDHFLHGAVCRVPENETAFNLRQRGCSVRLTSVDDKAGSGESSSGWVESLHAALQPFSAGRIYLNYLSGQSQGRVRAAFGTNYDRLLEIKEKYDPANFLRLNPNLRS